MTTPAPYIVSFHDELIGTQELEFVFGANARELFESLKTLPSVVDVQFWADGQMVEEWRRAP